MNNNYILGLKKIKSLADNCRQRLPFPTVITVLGIIDKFDLSIIDCFSDFSIIYAHFFLFFVILFGWKP